MLDMQEIQENIKWKGRAENCVIFVGINKILITLLLVNHVCLVQYYVFLAMCTNFFFGGGMFVQAIPPPLKLGEGENVSPIPR